MQVSDFLNGVVLLNPVLLPDGRHRPRYYKYGDRQQCLANCILRALLRWSRENGGVVRMAH